MSESRTFILDPPIVQQLAKLGTGAASELPSIEEILSTLPVALSQEEIDDVGIQVANEVERNNPSRDGLSHGRETERRVVSLLGFSAIQSEDFITAGSSIRHLRKYGGWVHAFLLGRELRRATRSH